MINLIEIYNLNTGEDDRVFINIEQISSIQEKNYGNIYLICMNNGNSYETDKKSFEKILKRVKVCND